MKRVRNARNYISTKLKDGEQTISNMSEGLTTSMVSETIPNQIMSMAELMERYVRTGEAFSLKNFDYEEEDDPFSELELQKMSKLDREHLLQETTLQVQSNELELKDIQESIRNIKAANKAALKQTPKGTEGDKKE